MSIGLGLGPMNPAMFARAGNSPSAAKQATQAATGGGNMFVGDKMAKKSQKKKAMLVVAGKVSTGLNIKKTQKVGKKKGA